MNKTKDTEVVIEWEYTDQRLSPHGYDEAYIEAFCNNPDAGKTAAILEAGYVGKYAKQEGYRIHKRLRERIEEQLDESILDGAHVGHNVLVYLAKNSDSDTVKAKCAKDLMDFAGRKAAERIKVTHELSDEEREAEIDKLQKEIAEQEGFNRKLDS